MASKIKFVINKSLVISCAIAIKIGMICPDTIKLMTKDIKMLSTKPPCIICVAITGSFPTKADNPNVPISINEQIKSTQESFEAGASIVHCHVRNDDQTPSSDLDRFNELLNGIKEYCPGMVIQFSSGGRSANGQERGGMLSLKPDMASLAVGSNNFPNGVYNNSPNLVE